MEDNEILEQEVANLRQTVQVLQELQQSEGWGQLVKLINGRRLGLRQSLFGIDSSKSGMDGLIDMARTQSELAGIEFVMNLPKFVMDDSEMQLQTLIMEMQNESEEQQEFRML